MAKKSSIENNNRKARLVKKFAARRKRLLDIANNEKLAMEERFEARLKLSQTPRNSAAGRVRNRGARAPITANSRCRASRCAISATRA